MNQTSFSNLVVLDFTRYVPGGQATQVFADLGAHVIKVEDTVVGDFCRQEPPMKNGVSFYHTALNRNKKSFSVNLKDPKGKEALLALAAKADVIIESFRPGVTKRLGIDYESIRLIQPGIIYCSITAYGQDDPRSLKALHDINLMAESGYVGVNGGVLTPISLCDLAAGMVAVQDVLAALYERQESGVGAYCDVSMFDAFVWWNTLLSGRYDFNGGRLDMEDLEHPTVGYNIYKTKDGRTMAFALMEQKFWKPFCEEMRFGADMIAALRLHRHEAPEAFERMEKLVASRTMAEWKEWLGDRDMCIAPVKTPAEAIPEIVASGTGLMEYRDLPGLGRTLQTKIPHKISALPVEWDGSAPPPMLGEDSASILLDLGYCPDEIRQMAADGAISGLRPNP